MSMKLNILHGVKSSLTRKLVSVSLMAALLPLISWGVFFYSYTMRNVEKEYLNSVSNNLKQLNYNLVSQVIACRQSALSFAGDANLVNFLQYGTTDDYLMVNIINNSIISRLRTASVYNPTFYSTRLIHGNEKIPDVYDFLYCDSKFKDKWWDTYLISLDRKPGQTWKEYYVDVSHKGNLYIKFNPSTNITPKDAQVFSLFYPILSTYNLELLGVFEISIKEDVFLKPLMDLEIAEGTVLDLVTSDNKVIYKTHDYFKGLNVDGIVSTINESIVKLGNQEYFFSKFEIPEINCWLVQYTPQERIYQNSAYGSLIFFGLMAVFFTISSISYLVFKLLLSNLNKLTKTIHLIKHGDLKARVDVKSNDEIGKLAGEFNEMAQKISELLKKVEDSGRAEKEAVYKSLENQISPHFICNALDTIRMTAETLNNRQIADATELISSYFMYNIYKRSKDVTLAEELKNVTDYLDIHNLIRRDRIEYVIKVSSEIRGHLDNYRIIKFSLQPIIENSIKHGFKSKNSKCLIIISISYSNGTIQISMEDNGAGMNDQELNKIKDLLDSGKNKDLLMQNRERVSSGIGLRNIKERLDINYGFQYTFNIMSYEGIGTKVIIEIPSY